MALKHPEKIAIIEDGVNYSYISLDKFSNKIANFLLSKEKKNNTIGIILPSSFSLISSMIGTLKSGNTYLLIDPNMPKKKE
ncbi:AMP-binding protein [Staphylococcus saprophyticus]